MPLDDSIPAITAKMQAAVDAAVAAGAEMVAESARKRVPYRTGALHDAIHTEPDADGMGVEVVAGGKTPENKNVFYAHMVEHGTTHSDPHPFLVPALEENSAAITAAIAKALDEATG